MEQIKKNPNDPDYDQLNTEIVQLARSNGNIRQPMELYLDGKLTWQEALETMVLLITKEFKAQQRILVVSLQEHPDLAMLAVGHNSGLMKALPPKPYAAK